MPYLITTQTPDRIITDDVGCTITHRAVATLDEAYEMVWEAVRANGMECAENRRRLVYRIPEHGGTVGPLPDGTVIEVRPMVNEFGAPDVRGFLRGWHFPASMDDAEIIDAYNEEADSC